MPIDMPASPGFIVRSAFWLETHTQTFTSPLNNATQRLLLGGARWKAGYTLRRMHAREAGAWQAFLMSLEGGVHTFNAFDPDKKSSRGLQGGIPLVSGAGQTGSSLAIDGLTPNVVGWALAGDLFSVNGELKMLTAPINSDGSGNATANFKPAIRNSPADNAPLTFEKPTCTMALIDDQQNLWESDRHGVYEEKTISAHEAFS